MFLLKVSVAFRKFSCPFKVSGTQQDVAQRLPFLQAVGVGQGGQMALCNGFIGKAGE